MNSSQVHLPLRDRLFILWRIASVTPPPLSPLPPARGRVTTLPVRLLCLGATKHPGWERQIVFFNDNESFSLKACVARLRVLVMVKKGGKVLPGGLRPTTAGQNSGPNAGPEPDFWAASPARPGDRPPDQPTDRRAECFQGALLG